MHCRYDYSRDDLHGLLGDEPTYRVEQLWHGMYTELREPTDITALPLGLREQLQHIPTFGSGYEITQQYFSDQQQTVKWLLTLHDGTQIETVVMFYEERVTVCISSQAGCAMNCSFCATGQLGFRRHLTKGEIITQVILAQRYAHEQNRKISNIVFMGMGEPLANFDATWSSIRRLHDDMGFGSRRITVSTVGIVPGILRLRDAPLAINLAVSLHAANDELRNSLVPINRKYPLSQLVRACRDYWVTTRRRVTLEWALIDSINDTFDSANELADIANQLEAHVNVIPLNPTPGYLAQGPTASHVRTFRDWLVERGVNVTIRDTRGNAIDAACGQLALSKRSSAANP